MPTLLRAQVVLKHVSGLPRDNVSNTFWFDGTIGGAGASDAEAIAEQLVTLYTAVIHGPSGGALMNYLSTSIVNNGHEIKLAPIDEATGEDTRGAGFPPLHTEVFDLLGRAPLGGQIPAEVATCLSFKNMSSGSVPPARRRGRVYFGPVNTAALTVVDGISRPHPNWIATVLEFGRLLDSGSEALGNGWRIYSRPFAGRGPEDARRADGTFLPAIPARAGSSYNVTDVWVDNAFDTQRRRGERATTRSTSVVDV